MTSLTAPQLQFLLNGLVWTVVLSLLAFAGGGLWGFAVAIGSVLNRRLERRLNAAHR